MRGACLQLCLAKPDGKGLWGNTAPDVPTAGCQGWEQRGCGGHLSKGDSDWRSRPAKGVRADLMPYKISCWVTRKGVHSDWG